MKIDRIRLQNIIDSLNFAIFDIDETVLDCDDPEFIRVLEFLRTKFLPCYTLTNNYLLRSKKDEK